MLTRLVTGEHHHGATADDAIHGAKHGGHGRIALALVGVKRAIDYRHYLPELARKPQAVRQVLPDLLRDLGDPFPAVWTHLDQAHGPREAARLLAKILGELATRGVADVIPALQTALATCAPLTMARIATAVPTNVELPTVLRDLEVTGGCAAEYDGWLTGAPA